MMPAINEMMLAVSSSLTASIVAKATVLLMLALIGTTLARRSRAAVRHALLAAAFGVLLALPAASLIVPPVRMVVSAPAPVRIASAPIGIPVAVPAAYSSVPAPAPRWKLSVATILLTGWIAGMALFLSPVLMGLWEVRSLRRRALPWAHGQAVTERLARDAGIGRRVEVLLHEDLPGPMTCGVLYPAIVLPEEARAWDAEDLHRAVVHELEHVRRGDWVVQCLARAVCAMYWFHPLVWTAWRRLTLEAERSCDDAVLGRSEATAYADQLVGLAQRLSSGRRTPLLAMVNRSDLATRVGALLDSRQRRGRAGAVPVALAGITAAALVLTISPFRMVAAAPPSAIVAAEPPAPVVAALPEEPAPQTPSPTPQAAPVPRFASRTNLVVVDVKVTDPAGNSIDGLGARDFVVMEDGVAQTISTFEYQKLATPAGTPNAPTSYYLLGYYSSNDKVDGQFRKIQVIDKNDTTAKLEYRTGYYANKEFGRANSGVAGPPTSALPAGTKPPVLVYKKEPAYSDEARQAKYQGTVLLSVEVNETGQVTGIHVQRSLGLGLDEKAMEAVKQWVFKPGTINGIPTAMQTQVNVDFRLL